MSQYDLFGNEVEIKEETHKHGNRYKKMQEIHGIKQGKHCKTCKHLCEYRYSRRYYKCGLWYQTSSAATDIRLKDIACGKYEERKVEDNER